MKSLNQHTNDNFLFGYKHLAKVVGIDDHLLRDRVQVRIVGLIADSIPDSDCPWAEQESPLFASNYDLSGVSTVPVIGSFVYIEFLYGDISKPVYTGYARGASDSSNLHHLKDLSQTIYQSRINNMIGPELEPLNDKSKYPFNNVIETNSGNVIELDDTDGNERIAIEHSKTSSYMEIRPDGTVVFKSMKDLHMIVKENVEEYIEKNFNSLIKGNFDRLIEGVSTTTVNKDNTLNVYENNTTNVKGDATETIDGSSTNTIKDSRTDTITNSDTQTVKTFEQNANDGRTITTSTTTHIGDLIIVGDIICSNMVYAKDCLSDGISGKNHTHIETGAETLSPQ